MYVIVYDGYEGYEEILWAGDDGEEAVRAIHFLRNAIEGNKQKHKADWFSQEAPWIHLHESDRICVMKEVEPFKFECACEELGVPPKEGVWH